MPRSNPGGNKAPEAQRPRKPSTAGDLASYGVVAISGAAVMMLEILGTRVIGPFYGMGLYVWSSLISVTLVALGLGYWLGGMVADGNRRHGLPTILLLAGVFTALVPVLRPSVLSLTNAGGVKLGSVAAAALLFFGPLTLLAMVGPIVIKRRANRLERIGVASGSVLAISTAGSVVGTLLVGFWLLPTVGTTSILLGLSGLLALSSAGVLLVERIPHASKRRWAAFFILGTLVPVAVYTAGAGDPTPTGRPDRYQVISDTESINGRVRVIDDSQTGIRWLMSDASTIGAARGSSGLSVFPYVSVLELIPLFKRDAKTALVIGLGAGHLPTALLRSGIQTDAIEIDPTIARLARQHFGYRETGRLIIGDARREIGHLERQYDFIVHDCFSGGAVAAHLLSLEMLRDLRARLKAGGVLAINYFGFTVGPQGAALAAIKRTIAEVFTHQRAFVSQPGQQLIDNLIFASNEPLSLGDVPLQHRAITRSNRWVVENLRRLEVREPIPPGFIVTDDYNPLGSMQAHKAIAYRELLAERLGLPLLAL